MKRWCCVLAIIGILSALLFANEKYQLFAINTKHSSQRYDIRVMTYNVNCSLDLSADNDAFTRLLATIRQVNPDVLCLQEVSQENFKWMADSLDAIFGYGESFGITHEVMRHVLYSKKPLRNFSRHKCIGNMDTTGFSTIDLKELLQITRQMPLYSAEIEAKPGQWVTIFSCHLRSSAYSTARKQMGVDANWIDGVPLYFRNYRIGKRIRDFEADNVRRNVDSIMNQRGQAVIVAGDFNDWSGSYCMNTIQYNDFKDAWWEGGNGFGFTYNGWHLRLRLDHILYSDNFELCGVKVIESDTSDHRALVADLRLK